MTTATNHHDNPAQMGKRGSIAVSITGKGEEETDVSLVKRTSVFLDINNGNDIPPSSFIARSQDLLFAVTNAILGSGVNLKDRLSDKGRPNMVVHLTEYFLVVFEDIQMISWAFAPKLKIANMPNIVHGIFDILEFRDASTLAISYGTLTILYALSMTTVLVLMALIAFIAFSISTGSFEYKWTLPTTRWLLIIATATFFMPILNSLLSPMECAPMSKQVPSSLFVSGLAKEDSIRCFGSQNLASYTLGLLVAICFVPLCFFFNLVFVNVSPDPKRKPRTRIHGRVSFIHSICKTVLVIIWKFGFNSGINLGVGSINAILASGASFLASTLLTFLMHYYRPHYNENMNHLRFSIYFTAIVANLISCIANVVFYFSGSSDNSGWMISLLASVVPSLVAGYLYSRRQSSKRNEVCEKAMVKYESLGGTDEQAKVLIFPSPFDVEALGRNLLLKESPPEIETLTRLFDHGLREFPDEPLLAIRYGQYLELAMTEISPRKRKHLITVVEAVNRNLALVKTRNNGFFKIDVEFQLYFLERIALRRFEVLRSSNQDSVENDDGFSQAEYVKQEKLAILEHDNVLKYLVKSWKLVLNKEYDARTLTTFSRQVYESALKARHSYERLVKRFPKRQGAYRAYAKFMLEVQNRPSKARLMLEKAKTASSITTAKNGKSNTTNETNVNEKQLEIEQDDIRKRLTMKARKTIRFLFFNNLLVLALTVIINLTNFILVFKAVSLGNQHMIYLHDLHYRDYLTSKIFREANLYRISLENKTDTGEINSKITDSANELLAAANSIFAAADTTSSSAGAALYSEASVDISSVNSQGAQKVSLYEAMRLYGESAKSLATNFNESYSFIVENYGTLQTKYDYDSEEVFLRPTLSSNTTANTVLIALTSVQLVSLILLLYLVDKLVGRFYRTQTKSLNLFRTIPTSMIQSMIENVTSGSRIEDIELEVFGPGEQSRLLSDSEREAEEARRNSLRTIDETDDTAHDVFYGLWRFRIRFFVFFGVALVLYSVFAIYNSSNITNLSQSYVVMDEFGMAITKGYSAASFAMDLKFPDSLSKKSIAQLKEDFLKETLAFESSYDNIIYGDRHFDPPGLSLNQLPKDIQTIILDKDICLLLNETRCSESDRFDSSYGYDKYLVSSGLAGLSRKVLLKLDLIRGQCSLSADINTTSSCNPDLATVKFLSAATDNDFTEGYLKCMQVLIDSSDDSTASTSIANGFILAFTIILLILGYIHAFNYMILYLTQRSSQIAEMFMFVPSEIIETVPELKDYIASGDV